MPEKQADAGRVRICSPRRYRDVDSGYAGATIVECRLPAGLRVRCA